MEDVEAYSNQHKSAFEEWFTILCEWLKFWVIDINSSKFLLQFLEWLNVISLTKISIDIIEITKVLYFMKETIDFHLLGEENSNKGQNEIHLYSDVLEWRAQIIEEICTITGNLLFDNQDYKIKFIETEIFSSIFKSIAVRTLLRI